METCTLANIDTLQKAIVLFTYPTASDGEPDNGPYNQETLEYTDAPTRYYCNTCGKYFDEWAECAAHLDPIDPELYQQCDSCGFELRGDEKQGTLCATCEAGGGN